MSGKGDKRRPRSVEASIEAENWDRIFGKKTVECCACGLPVRHLPPDGISVCDDCGVVEGSTTLEELKDD